MHVPLKYLLLRSSHKNDLYSLYRSQKVSRLISMLYFTGVVTSDHHSYITTQCQTAIFCTPLSSTTPTRLQPVAGSNVGRYISEFQHSLQGIYTRTARIIYPVDYVKTYSKRFYVFILSIIICHSSACKAMTAIMRDSVRLPVCPSVCLKYSSIVSKHAASLHMTDRVTQNWTRVRIFFYSRSTVRVRRWLCSKLWCVDAVIIIWEHRRLTISSCVYCFTVGETNGGEAFIISGKIFFMRY